MIQHGQGDDQLVVVVDFPDALPSVPPIHRELAYGELSRAIGVAFQQLDTYFSEYYTDLSQEVYRVSVPLSKHKGDLEVLIFSTRHVDADIVEGWVQSLLVGSLKKWLQPNAEEIACLEAQRVERCARRLGYKQYPLDGTALDKVHSELWPEAAEIDFDFPSSTTRPDEPDETTYEHVLPLVEPGLHDEIHDRIDLAGGLLYDPVDS